MAKRSGSATRTTEASRFPMPFEALVKTMVERYQDKTMETFTKMFVKTHCRGRPLPSSSRRGLKGLKSPSASIDAHRNVMSLEHTGEGLAGKVTT